MDWYAPISNVQKMIMTLINMSILLIVLIFFFYNIKNLIWKICIISAVSLTIILFFLLQSKTRFIKDTKESSQSFSQIEPTTYNQPAAQNSKNTLQDVFSKIMTVFNSVFTIMNVFYFIYIFETLKDTIPDNNAVFNMVFTADNALIIHGTILFWSTISTVILSAKGWQYDDEIKRISKKKRIEYNAEFFANRVTERNRK